MVAVVRMLRLVEQVADHRPDERYERYGVPARKVPETGRGEPRGEHRGTTDDQRVVQAAALPDDVVHRQDDEGPVIVYRSARAARPHPSVGLCLGDLDALRQPGGA